MIVFKFLNQKGTGMTEICCLLALIAIAAVASLGYLGNAVEKKFTDQANLLDSNSPGAIPGGRDPNLSGFNSSSGSQGGYTPGIGGGVN